MPNLLLFIVMWMVGALSSFGFGVAPLAVAVFMIVKYNPRHYQVRSLREVALLAYAPFVAGAVLGTAWLFGLSRVEAAVYAGVLSMVFWGTYSWSVRERLDWGLW